MGAAFPAISAIISDASANISSLATYLVLPIVALVFTVTVVWVAVVLLRKNLVKAVTKSAGVGGSRGGRGKRR